MLFGSHRKPEAVILPYETYEAVRGVLEDLAIAVEVDKRDRNDDGTRYTLTEIADELGKRAEIDGVPLRDFGKTGDLGDCRKAYCGADAGVDTHRIVFRLLRGDAIRSSRSYPSGSGRATSPTCRPRFVSGASLIPSAARTRSVA